jgi:hypothetical protein
MKERYEHNSVLSLASIAHLPEVLLWRDVARFTHFGKAFCVLENVVALRKICKVFAAPIPCSRKVFSVTIGTVAGSVLELLGQILERLRMPKLLNRKLCSKEFDEPLKDEVLLLNGSRAEFVLTMI